MIDYEESAKINSCSIKELKERFIRFPHSGKHIIAICDDCKESRILKYQDYCKICSLCTNTNKEHIERRVKGHLGGERISDEELYKLYIVQEKNTVQISKITGVSPPTVLKWLREANIQIRSSKERNLGKLNPNWHGGYKIVICNYCNKNIEKIHSTIGNHNFCNKECESKWRSIHNCGENNSGFQRRHTKDEIEKQIKSIKKTYENKRWNNQIDKFISGEPIQDFIFTMINNIVLQDYNNWRYTIYKRDNYTCQICGKNNCMIHAHHIIPKRMNKNLIFDINNGITLCKKCHETTFGKENLFINKLQMIINKEEQ